MIDFIALENKASQLRKQLDIKPDDAVNVLALAQRMEKLTIIYYPLGKKLSGMCVKGQSGNNVIAINSSMTLGRQNFTMAHEFYHLFYDENKFTICVKALDKKPENEIAADFFASCFLMPVLAMKKFLKDLKSHASDNKITLEDIIHIEQFFGVSHQATIYRLKYMKYIDVHEFETFLHTPVRRKAEEIGYSPVLYEPMPKKLKYMTFGHYIKQANDVWNLDLVSDGKYEELLLEAFRSDLVYGDVEEGDLID